MTFLSDRRLATVLRLSVLTAACLSAAARGQVPEVETTNWRYDEDWSVVKGAPPQPDDPWWLPLKHVPLDDSGAVYASFGLEARARYEGFRDNFWGGPPAPEDGYLWLRLMPHADLHAGPLRAFVQPILGVASGVDGGNGPADATGADLLQGFADARIGLGGKGTLTIRGGRELIALGSERLVGIRYGPNIPQAFDGVRLMLDHGPVTAQLIAVKPVQVGQGDFDDRTSRTKRLRGIYATGRVGQGVSVDAYWLNYRNRSATFVQGTAEERRDSFGVRLFGSRSGWAWNWEGVLQRGRFGAARIRAWTVAGETSYRFETSALKPKLLLRANYASGDRRADDPALNTFNALFPKGKYFGELSPLGPYNILNLHFGAEAEVAQGVTLGGALAPYWRASIADGIYDVPGQILRDGTGSDARFIGISRELTLNWQPDRATSLAISYSHFPPGPFLRETGSGRTIHMVGAEAMYRF